MLYLLMWAYQLVGRSGAGMDGLAPLSYATIEAWARLHAIDVRPEEAEALLELDAALRNPDPDAVKE